MDTSSSLNEIVEGNFMPHGHCLLWRTDLLLMHVVSDVVITLSYYVIPFALVYFIGKRKDLAFNWIFALFSAFIFACGTTHLMSLINIWHGYYYTAGMLKVLTATISLLTAFVIWPLIPKALALPSPVQLQQKNRELEHEIQQRNTMETELRSVNAELWKSNTLQRAIFDSTSYLIISTNADGIIMSINSAAEHASGYTSEELVGRVPLLDLCDKNILAFNRFGEEDHNLSDRPRDEESTILKERECNYICRDGSSIPVALSAAPLRDPTGEITGFVIIGNDITERKRLDKMKREFVATVSHELRTPLTSISGSLGLLSAGVAGELPAQAQNLTVIAHRNCLRLNSLVDDILDIEKVESGQLEYDFAVTPLPALITEGVNADLAFALKYNVNVKSTASIDPATNVKVDKNRILQVLSNLLSNAIKFAPSGSTVEIDITGNGDDACITISDRGPGIAEEFQDQLFQPFTQYDASDTRQKDGTGLGLSISKAIVEKHAGRLTFTTVIGEGTTFYVYLPIHQLVPQTEVALSTTVE